MNKYEISKNRGYFVCEKGELYNPQNKKIGKLSNRGYIYFTLKINNRKTNIFSHRLQAYQKYGDNLFQKGIEVRHKNNIKTDNSWNNILVGTHSENMMDIPKQLRIKRAIHASSFLRKHNNDEIKKFHKKYKSYKKTMEKFNISSKGTLHYILSK